MDVAEGEYNRICQESCAVIAEVPTNELIRIISEYMKINTVSKKIESYLSSLI